MKCPNCGNAGNKAFEVIKTDKFDQCTMRAVQCKKCFWSGTTVEQLMEIEKPKNTEGIRLPNSI
jgi:uncharacterized Zn finger protein